MAKVTVSNSKKQSRVVSDRLPGVTKLASNNKYVMRRKLICGLWEPEDWRWLVLQPSTKAVLSSEESSDWSYDEAIALAKDLGDDWIITPSVAIENEWGTIHARLRELGWGIRCSWTRNACDIEIWKAGKVHRWSGQPHQAELGFRDVALLVVDGDSGVESPERTAPGRRRRL